MRSAAAARSRPTSLPGVINLVAPRRALHCVIEVLSEDPGRNARCPSPRDDVHQRIGELAAERPTPGNLPPVRHGEVARPDVHGVEAINGEDRVEVLER